MRFTTLFIFSIVIASTVGCTPANIIPLSKPSDNNSGEVIVYKEEVSGIDTMPMILGVDGNDIASLENNTYTSFHLTAGEHTVYARGNQADEKNILTVTIENDSLTCLLGKTKIAEDTLKSIIPIFYWTSSAFDFSIIDCEKINLNHEYKKVNITYESDKS